MKSKTLRIIIPIFVGLVVAVGFVFKTGIGNLSAIGWREISILCPLGALTTMLASKTIIPRALISLAIAIVLMLVLGRLFCGWICPIPVINKMPHLFKKKGGETDVLAKKGCENGCASCREQAKVKFDSRHLVLVGALISATVFGFPVFCLICPIGLSFATIFLVISLFTGGDLTWSIFIVPVLLLLEVTVFKKWCSKICPLGALMSLMGKVNKKTLRPTVDIAKCIETDRVSCGRCSAVCEVHIDPRHPENGAEFSECLKCRECIEACPVKAITMPILPKRIVEDTETP